jgi:hypothetical protein
MEVSGTMGKAHVPTLSVELAGETSCGSCGIETWTVGIAGTGFVSWLPPERLVAML